jgi:hypothetical protein
VKVEWSADALADLDRFAAFLHERHPDVASIVAREIIAKALGPACSRYGRGARVSEVASAPVPSWGTLTPQS